MKEISKKEMDKLVKYNYLKNTSIGYVDRRGRTVGFYRTRNKRYMEDKYVDIAKKLI